MRLLFVLSTIAALLGQNSTEDHRKAADYPVSATAGQTDIGAEFLVHSIPSERGYYFAKSYLVVDVGVFPRLDEVLKISASQFAVRLNGGSVPLLAQSPGMVAASLKYPDWGQQTGLSGGASVGDIGITTNRPPVGRFPGDPNGRTLDPNDEEALDQQIYLSALPDVTSGHPVRGCVFFASDIKAKKIKSLELEWTGPAGEHALLKLR